MSEATDPTEQANRCRNLLFSMVRQALIDHRVNLQNARSELNAKRRRAGLPSATDGEALALAMSKEPAVWLLSEDIGRMSFRWCCEHIGVDPSWVRVRMNRREFGFSLDRHEKQKAA